MVQNVTILRLGITRRLASWLYREREIMFRSGGHVRYIRVRPVTSLCLFFALLAFVGAGVGAGTLAVWQQRELAAKSMEVTETRLTYDHIRADVESYTTQLDALLRDIDDAGVRRALAELAVTGNRIAEASGSLTQVPEISQAMRISVMRDRQALYGHIATLEHDLAETQERAEDTRATLTDSQRRLQLEQRGAEAARRQVQTLGDRVAALRKDLNTTRAQGRERDGNIKVLNVALEQAHEDNRAIGARNRELESAAGEQQAEIMNYRRQQETTRMRIGALVDRLAMMSGTRLMAQDSRAAVQVLEDKVADIAIELEATRARAGGAENMLDDVIDGLTRVTGRSVESLQSGGLVETARFLLNDIEGLHEAQRGVVERLSGQVMADLGTTENLLLLAGVDPNQLTDGEEGTGKGGPLIVTDFDSGVVTRNLDEEVVVLETRLARLRALRRAMRCVPLIPPLDSYHVTSKFGKRRDPFTKQWAMHYGIDLGGPMGMRIRATAPGVVSFAGVKSNYGKMIEIDHGCGFTTLYGHLRKVLVKKGERVSHRQVIGNLGNSGRSTGPHVHYEIMLDGVKLNPSQFIEAGKHVFKT